MSLYVQVVNGEVRQCWDTPPPAGETGWVSAIEVRPEIIPHRQMYTAHRFDVSKTPVEIVYGVQDISYEDRKVGMIQHANMAFQMELQRQAANPASYDPVALQTIKDSTAPRIAAIEAAESHDDLDALMETTA
jgi:hypothetical protein